MGQICWVKLTDPDVELPVAPPGTDVRVLLPAGDEFENLRDKLAANGIGSRKVPYLVETETITGHTRPSGDDCTVVTAECHLIRSNPRQFPPLSGVAAITARDTYNLLWQNHAPAGHSGTDLRAVLGALVRLTQPVMIEGEALPGWWTLTGPTGRVEDEFPGGHGNLGLAHGISVI